MKSALRERLRTLDTEGQDALTEMTEYALTRKEDCHRGVLEMFDEKLKKYADMQASKFDFRLCGTQARPETRTIFDHALSPNFSLQLVRSVIKFILSRVDKDTFGSRPWISVSPRGMRNQALSAQIQKHGEYKLIECSWRDRSRGAMKDAFDYGWVPVKTTWRDEWDVSESLDSILTSGADPVVVQEGEAAGDYISPEDDTVGPDDEAAEPPGMQDEGAEGEPATPRVFAKDPSVPAPDGQNGLAFKSHLIETKERIYCGLDFSPLAHRDVSWPVDASDMSLDCPECDMIAVNTQMTVDAISLKFNPDGDDEELAALVEELRSTNGCPKSEAAMPKKEQNEPEVRTSDLTNPPIKVVECYFRRRIPRIDPKTGKDTGGPESRIYMVIAEESRKPIYVEYLAHISPRSQAPVHMVAINRVPGRAYGRGWYEYFEMAQDQLDRLFNGVSVRNEYGANPEEWIDAKAAEQLPTGQAAMRGPGLRNIIENKMGGALSNLFYTNELPATEAETWKMIELIMQLVQTESGVTNAAQGDMTNLPGNATASGTNSLLESSSVTHTYILEEVRSGLTPPVRYALELTYFRQDGDDAYDLLDDASAIGQVEQASEIALQGPQAAPQAPAGTSAQQPGVMTYAMAQKLRNVPLHVEILLSRAKRQEQKEMAFAAIPVVQSFLLSPPDQQIYLRKFVVQALRGLGEEDPESSLPTMEQIQQQIAAMQASQSTQGPEERISLREQMSYADTPPSIRRQMEKQAGFEPATEEEHAAEVATMAKEAKPDPKEAVAKEPAPAQAAAV